MKTRPWPLVILAVIQILTPFTNILFNAYSQKVPVGFILSSILENPPRKIFEILFLMPIAGIGIFRMTKGGYAVFFGAMIWSAWSHYRSYLIYSDTYPLWAMLSTITFEIILVVYFLLPSVRATYFNPRVRWWESKPRYEIDCPCQIHSTSLSLSTSNASLPLYEAKIVNLSQGGAFVRTKYELLKGDQVRIAFKVAALLYEITGSIVHVSTASDGQYNLGIQFIHTPLSADKIEHLIKGLKIMGMPERLHNPPWYQELATWLVGLLKSGKGFTPEIKERK